MKLSIGFEDHTNEIFLLQNKTAGLKPMIDELAPMLNAYLNSIGPLTLKPGSKKPIGEQGNY